MNLTSAAADLGLWPAELSEKLAQSPALLRILGPLRVPGRTVQRSVFAAAMVEIARDLHLGALATGEN